MHSNGPPQLHINPPYYQQQQRAPTSAPYFSSPATYSPLPFAQQISNSGENGGFFPAGRQDGASVGYAGIPMNIASMNGAPMMGLGLSQMSEAPSMLRSSSSSSYSSSSSFVPTTPNTFGAYFSPPLQQSSPALFSPPLPASPSFSSNSIRPIPPRTKLHAHAPSFHIPTSSPPARRSNKNLSISVRGGNPFPQRHSRNESTFKATTPLGIGTRPDEEAKKKKKVLVRMPKEREKEEEDGREDDRKQSKFCRVPLGRDDKLRKMEKMERDLKEGAIMLEEDEIVGKLCHYDEQKSPSLPSTIEVYLPGLAGWEVAWEEFGEESYTRFGSFDVPKPAFLEPSSPTLPRSSLSSPIASFSPLTPLHAAPHPPPPSSQRSHTRTFSLFDSPVALPARLQNVLDSLSGRRASHSSSMSLSSPQDQLNPAATPFMTSKPSSQSKLTPFAPAFTLPSWAAIKAKAQGVPLPDTDESMEEGIEGDDTSPNDTIEASREMVESPVAMEEDVLAREGAEESKRAVDTKMEEAKDEEGPIRKLSGVSTRTDHTGIASISDGFLEKDGSHAGDQGGRGILAGSPDASNGHLDNSPPNWPPSSLGGEISRALTDLGPLDTTAGSPNNDSSNHILSANIEAASKEEASEGDHKVNKSFEFPLRSPAVSPEKPRRPQLLPSRETLDSAPIETATNFSSDIPTTLAFRQAGDSLQNSPTLFGMNGAPGPLATSSPRNDSPLPSSPHASTTQTEGLTTEDLEPLRALRPLSACDGLNDDTKSNSASPSPSVPLVRPTPRRPYLDPRNDSPLTAPAPFPFANSSNLASTSSSHSFDFRLPSHAPRLPSHQQSESPRKISHGPLPPIPLLAITSSHDSATKRQKIETPQTAHDVIRPPSFYRAVSTPNISARRPLPTPPADYRPRTPSNCRASYDFGSLSLASLDDAIPEQYSPKRSSHRNGDDRPFELRAMASFSLDGRILGYNGGTSSKIRSPLPTFSTPGSSIDAGSSNQRGRQESADINLPTTSRSKSRAVAISSGTVDAVDERHSSDTNSSRDTSGESSVVELSEDGLVDGDEDDTPLRILEGIIERQFDGLRAELKTAASTLQQDTLVEAVANRLEGLLVSTNSGRTRALSLSTQQLGLSPTHGVLRPTTPALESHPAAAYSVFLDDLRATVLPLIQVPIDTHSLTTELTVQLQQELARHSEEMLKAVSTRHESASSPALGDLKQVATKPEGLAEAAKDLSSKFSQLAQDVNLSQAASTNLKSTMGQLSLDVTSRVDSAYSALDTLLQEHLAKLPSPDYHAKFNDLEAQLAKARSDHGSARSERAVLEERLLNEKTRRSDEAAQLRSDLLSAQATIKKLEEEKLESITKSARLEADFANSQESLHDLKQSLITRDERLRAIESEKLKMTVELGEARAQIEQLSQERDQLCRIKDALVQQYSKHPCPSPPIFDHARLDSTESDPDLSSTPPSRRSLSKRTSSSRPSTPTKLVPQLTGGSDESDDTIAHTDVSPSPSVLGRSYVLSDDGWYSEA